MSAEPLRQRIVILGSRCHCRALREPSSQVTMSAPVEGMLMEVRVREGQRVEQGEILAVLDNRVAQAAVHVARTAADQAGEIQQAREELNFSKIHFDRQLELKAATGGSGFELLEAETRYEKAKAALLAAEQNQRRAQGMLELELTRLEAHTFAHLLGARSCDSTRTPVQHSRETTIC